MNALVPRPAHPLTERRRVVLAVRVLRAALLVRLAVAALVLAILCAAGAFAVTGALR